MCDRLKGDTANKNTMFSLKRRSNQWDNEFNKKICSTDKLIPIFYGDRFIPRRFSIKSCERNLKFSIKKSEIDVLSLSSNCNYWRPNTFLPAINLIMGMTHTRILKLMDPVLKSTGILVRAHSKNSSENEFMLCDWPCRPRLKPFASIDTTFDLPDYDSNCDQNLVDWSIRGQIVVSFGHDVIIWHSKEDITMAFEIKCPRCLAYSPNGELLAIGCKSCEYPVLELWDVSTSQDFCVICGKVFSLNHTSVLCIEWTLSGKQIACGTQNGTLYILSVPNLNTIKKIRKYNLPLTIIRFSPNMRYLATGDSEGNIFIYNWNMCTVHLRVRSRRKLSAVFDWHPWTGVDLAISENVPASIVLLHVPSKKIVAYYQQNRSKIAINYISFSKLTGELLVSTYNPGDAGYPLEPWLLTPHRIPEDGSPAMRFNEAHAKCRNIIERTNGVLKNRWRCLLGARELHYIPEKAAKIINVCSALHNVCIHYKVSEVPTDFVQPNMPEEDTITPQISSQYLTVAQSVRDSIGQMLF